MGDFNINILKNVTQEYEYTLKKVTTDYQTRNK